MLFSPETISSSLPVFELGVSSLWLALTALLPFLAMSLAGDEEEHAEEHRIDLDALKKRVAELEGVSARSIEQSEELAELYVVQATCFFEDGEAVDDVLALLGKAEDVLKQTLAQGEDIEIRRRLGDVYLHRAVVFNDCDEIESALEYYELAIATLKPLDDKGDGEAKYDIAGIQLNRGIIYHEIGDYEKARTDLDESFMAYRAVEKISDQDTRYYMAKVSVAQGCLFRDMGEPLDKIVDAYNRAMRLYVELIDIGQMEHERDLANALLDRCTATYEDYMEGEFDSETDRLNKFGDVLVDVGRGIEILEKLAENGDEEARSDLFNALVTEGAMLLDIEKFEEAYKVFDRAVKEFGDFGDEADPALINHYAGAYENRGICSLNLGNLDEAIVDINEAIRLREKIVSKEFGLDDESKSFFMPGLATTFANRANVHSTKGDVETARSDVRHGLELIRALGESDDDYVEIEQIFESMLEQWK